MVEGTKSMLIVSQNITNYDIPLPKDAVFRINLAWVNSIDELKTILKKHESHAIFLDFPVNRTKPPNNKYTLNDVVLILQKYNNIKYIAISNVETETDLDEYLEIIPNHVTIIPKIESQKGIENIETIVKKLEYKERIIMLDHVDLYSDLLKSNLPPSKFTFFINKLTEFCNSNNIILLRTIGVLFSDEEKRITEYVN